MSTRSLIPTELKLPLCVSIIIISLSLPLCVAIGYLFTIQNPNDYPGTSFLFKQTENKTYIASNTPITYTAQPITTQSTKPNRSLIISPLFKLFGGGATNNDPVITFLTNDYLNVQPINQQSLVMVDIGMYDGKESLQAVKKGFTVFGFEPIYSHIINIINIFKSHNMSQYMKFINVTQMLINDANNSIYTLETLLNELESFPIINHTFNESISYGFLYMFQCAASDHIGTVKMRPVKVWSNIGITDDLAPTVVLLPVSLIVRHDVFWFKSDTQGYEYGVLNGSIGLFRDYNVEYMTIEYWPFGILDAYGPDGLKMLFGVIEEKLLMDICFPQRKDENRLSFTTSMNVSQFISISRTLRMKHGSRFWDDLTCIRQN